MRRTLVNLSGLSLALGALLVFGCAKHKALNPVAPETQTLKAQAVTTLTWTSDMQQAVVTYDAAGNMTHINYLGYHWPVYLDVQSAKCTVFPEFSGTTNAELTCSSKPGRTLCFGFSAGNAAYVVEKGPADAIFCYYIDSSYPVYDGSYVHKITTYNLPLQKAEWNMDNTLSDSTGKGNTALNVNGVTFVQGGSGYAARFTGSNYLKIPTYANFNNMQAYTLSAWIRPTALRSYNMILGKVNPNRDFVMQLDGTGKLNAHFAINSNEYHGCTSTQILPLNQWSHVSAVWTGTKWQLYINGVLNAEADGGGKVPAWTGTIMNIGAMNNAYAFTGMIDAVMVVPVALNASQINRVYQNGMGHLQGNY